MVGKFNELGVATDYNPSWGLRQDDFVPELRGTRGVKKLREMRENDPVIGAILSAMDLMIRSVEWRVEGGDESDREFVLSLMHEMDGSTWESFISDVLSFLPYGFSLFEIVMKRRADGLIGIRKLAPRPQWTVDRFESNVKGDVLGVWQIAAQKNIYIPYGKLLHFKTVSINGEPSGRSVLRNAYTSWRALNEIKYIEAVAIERELNGLPIVSVPSEYLNDEKHASFLTQVKKIARDVKRNEQGYIILPSDRYTDEDGKITNNKMVEFDLIASKGTRDIDTNQVILRYAQDIARSTMADFIMLGSNDRGSFALSKSKADLFLKALEGYLGTISAVLNRRLLTRMWEVNGMDQSNMPKIVPGRVAPIDIDELGQYVQRLALAGVDLFPDMPLEQHLRSTAGLPARDPNKPVVEPAVDGDGAADGDVVEE